METNTEYSTPDRWRDFEKTQRRGRIAGGLIIITAGVLFLMREIGMDVPGWLLTWKMLLIVIGTVGIIKHRGRHPGWILIFVGAGFLLHDHYPELHMRPYLWPVAIILLGLFILFKPRRRYRHTHRYQRWRERMEHSFPPPHAETASDDFIDSVVFMAAVKKNIVTRNFRGGDITNVLGGTELNLMEADINGTVKLEVTQVFGGTKLIVPSNWEVRSELVTVLGSVEDKRPHATAPAGEKVLVLAGTTFMGGIEIKSY